MDQHRRIFTAMVAMAERNEPIGSLALMDALERRGDLEEAGGAALTAELRWTSGDAK